MKHNKYNHGNSNWTHDELMVAINLYCKIPFKSTHKTSPEIIKWAKVIGRTPGALYAKLCNFGRFDVTMQQAGIKGLSHGSKHDGVVWKEFEQNPEAFIYQSEVLLAKMQQRSVEDVAEIVTDELPQGEMRKRIVRQRVNQHFFRQAVLLGYDYQCCVSGVGHPQLIEACHISPWSDDVKNRTNPKNGLCMNKFFHSAFDNYLIGVSPDFIIDVSDKLIDTTVDESFR